MLGCCHHVIYLFDIQQSSILLHFPSLSCCVFHSQVYLFKFFSEYCHNTHQFESWVIYTNSIFHIKTRKNQIPVIRYSPSHIIIVHVITYTCNLPDDILNLTPKIFLQIHVTINEIWATKYYKILVFKLIGSSKIILASEIIRMMNDEH